MPKKKKNRTPTIAGGLQKQQVLHAKLPSESEFQKFLKVYPPSYTHSYTMITTKQHTNIWTKESVPKCSNLCSGYYYYYYSLRVVAIWVMFQVSKNKKKEKRRESPPEENLTCYKTTTTKRCPCKSSDFTLDDFRVHSLIAMNKTTERGYNEFIA